ncbi:diacylglycerol/polyprenol kinase family protein [Aspergillus stella-maris]|uniref:diacylglycerol/polyprenol kinase family protein n=1 Tax=Aspergillus stella-maris TaxID=1810926 RepID=UPI003CCE2174
MSSARNPGAVPATPRVISPSPTPEGRTSSRSRDDYSAPTTRSAARRQQRLGDVTEGQGETADTSPTRSRRRKSRSKKATSSEEPEALAARTNGNAPQTNGFLSPLSKTDGTRLVDSISRSPSPLGLIPLHSRYRSFIHRHEIPRKLLHVSIGFLTLHLYSRGTQTYQITPWLFGALVPIAATDILRHRSERVNKLYIRCMGALMRETEVSGYNGVIWYLVGAYSVLRFFPKDVGVMGVLLLSWCDTAASTFGRLYGRYTYSLRKGKSLAGTVAAWLVGVVTAAAFWGWFVPYMGSFPNDPENAFLFTGRLNLLPDAAKRLVGWAVTTPESESGSIITGGLALGVMSVVSGIVAAGSEFIDLFGWDDNLTIPVLSGIGLWGFLKIFG